MEILRLPGFQLNTDDRKLNNIIRAIGRNNELCPCKHEEWDDATPESDKKCPCITYRNGQGCHCNLYVKIEN